MNASKSNDSGGKNESKPSPLGLITEKQRPVSIKSVKVDVHITGYVAEVSSRLTYINKEKTAVDTVFTFPANDGSAVFLLEADIGKRHIVADVQRKEQVELTAQDAEEHGKAALLYKEDNSAGDIFSCTLGNLPAQSEASLAMKYVIELPQEADGQLRFTLPTVLNPRYSPAGGDGEIATRGATYVSSSKFPYEFSMTATVEGYHKVTSVTSDRVKLDVKYENDNKIAKVSVSDNFKFDHDLQLLVQYEAPYTPQIVLENGNPKAEGLMKEDICMVNFQPDLKKVSMATSGEYIFVIERSKRMADNNNIENARKALLLFLKSLPPDCYFNIISFGSKVNSLFRNSKKYTDSTLKDAIKLHGKMKADMGGSEILKPLEHIFGKKIIAGHPRRVLIVTLADATVDRRAEKYTSQVHELVKKHSQMTCTRVFTLGFGVPNSFLKGIAYIGGGKAEFLADQERIQPKVISLLKSAMQPAIMDITLCWNLPQGVTTAFIPTVPPTTVSAGERFTLYAILQGVDKKAVHASSTVTLKGLQDGKSISHSMTFTLCRTDDVNTSAPVHRLATKFEIQLAQDQEASCLAIDRGYRFLRDDCDTIYTLRGKIIGLSCHGKIVSKYTSFIAIDTEGKRVESKAVQRSYPVPTMSQSFIMGINESMMMNVSLNLCDSGLGGLSELEDQYFSEVPAVSAAACADGAVSVVDDDELMSVIILQHLCGQWNMTNELLKLLRFSKEDMEKLDFSKDPSILCTVIVLSWLWKQFSHRQEEWEMIETKALSWISSKNLNTPTEDIIQQATQTLWAK